MAEDWRSLYPFDSKFLDVDGPRLHFVDQGAGTPVLMVHGNPTWSFYWRELIRALQPHCRAVAVDHVGCGLSDKPQRYPYTLQQHTNNLIRLCDHLQLRQATLVAHDWGGAIGLGAVLERPESFARLVLLNTGAFPPPRVPWRIAACRTPLLGRAALRGLNLFARAALWMAVERPLPPAVKRGLLAPYDSWAHRVAIWRFVRDIPLTRRHPAWQVLQRLESRLGELRDKPAQLIWGMKDWCFDQRCLNKLQLLLPQAEVHRLQDAGHYVMEDARQQIVSLVESFLADDSNGQ